MTEATEAEAKSEEKETLLILLTPIPIPLFDLHWIVTLLVLYIITCIFITSSCPTSLHRPLLRRLFKPQRAPRVLHKRA